MANCVFCEAGSTLIDLMPEYYHNTYFSSVAQGVGMKYVGVLCKNGFRPSKTTGNGPHAEKSFEVNIPLLKNVLDSTL
jgi:hypothetical protein